MEINYICGNKTENMKNALFVVAFLMSMAVKAPAQDIITLKNGTEIEAKILEVGISEIRYRKFSNPDGPVYTMLKSDVLLVRYENGENEVFPVVAPTSQLQSQASDSNAQYAPYSAYASESNVQLTKNMKYRQYKDLYSPGDYRHASGDPYSRALAGIASAFIPGLGQGLDGEWGRAAMFFAGYIACSLISEAGTKYTYDSAGILVDAEYSSTAILAAFAGLAVEIWSICDAVRVAKIKNMYSQDIHKKYGAVSIDVKPCLAMVPAFSTSGTTGLTPSAGFALSVRF